MHYNSDSTDISLRSRWNWPWLSCGWLTSTPDCLTKSEFRHLARSVEAYETVLVQGKDPETSIVKSFLLDPSALHDAPTWAKSQFHRLLFLWKLLDEITYLSGDVSPCLSPRQYVQKMVSGPSARMYTPRLSNWKKVILNSKDVLSKWLNGHVAMNTDDITSTNCVEYNLRLLQGIYSVSDADPILTNIVLATMFLARLMENDFNGLLPDWDKHITGSNFSLMNASEGASSDTLLLDAAIHLPLYIVIFVSPIFVLAGLKIQNYNWKTESLITYSRSLGNVKPDIIKTIEAIIWNQLLFPLASAQISLVTAVSKLLTVLPWEEMDELSSDITGFFDLSRIPPPVTHSADALLAEDVPDAVTSSLLQSRTAHVPEPASNSDISSPDISNEPMPNSPPRLDQNPQEPDHAPDSPVLNIDNPSVHGLQVQSRLVATQSGSSENPHCPIDAPASDTGRNLRKLTPVNYKNIDKSYAPDTQKKSNPKRKVRTIGFQHASRFGDIASRTVDIHPDVIYDIPQILSMKHSMPLRRGYWESKRAVTLQNSPLSKPHSLLVSVFSITGAPLEFNVHFHHSYEREHVDMWLKHIRLSYAEGPNGKSGPLYIVAPEQSAFAIVDPRDMSDHGFVQRTITHKHIVFQDGSLSMPSFNEESVAKFHSTRCMVSMRDLSVDCHESVLGRTQGPIISTRTFAQQSKLGRIRDVLDSAENLESHILDTDDVGMPTGSVTREGFTSDIVAWMATAGEKLCPDDELLPASWLRWTSVTNAGAIRWLRQQSDGFGRYMDVKIGAVMLIVANPVYPYQSYFEHLDNKFDVTSPTYLGWSYESVVLIAGSRCIIRPNTRYIMLFLDHTIITGGMFYATSTMPSMLRGLIHSFACDEILGTGFNPASRTMLQRMVVFLHVSFVQGDSSTTDRHHLPDLKTASGIRSFITVAIIGIVLVVFDVKSYQLSLSDASDKERRYLFENFTFSDLTMQERDSYVYIRGLAYELLMWLDHKFFVSYCPVDGMEIDTDEYDAARYDDMMIIIGRVLAEAVEYYRRAASEGIKGAPGCDTESMIALVEKTFSCDGTDGIILHSFKDELIRLEEDTDILSTDESVFRILNSQWILEDRVCDEPYKPKGDDEIIRIAWSDAEESFLNGLRSAREKHQDADTRPNKKRKVSA